MTDPKTPVDLIREGRAYAAQLGEALRPIIRHPGADLIEAMADALEASTAENARLDGEIARLARRHTVYQDGGSADWCGCRRFEDHWEGRQAYVQAAADAADVQDQHPMDDLQQQLGVLRVATAALHAENTGLVAAIEEGLKVLGNSRLRLGRKTAMTKAILLRVRRATGALGAVKADAWDEGWVAGNFYAIDDFNRDGRDTNPYRATPTEGEAR